MSLKINRFSVATTVNTVKNILVYSLRRSCYSLRHRVQAASVVRLRVLLTFRVGRRKTVVSIWKIRRKGESNYVPMV